MTTAKTKNDLDTTLQILESALKTQEEQARLEEQTHHSFAVPSIVDFAQGILQQASIPELGVIVKSAQELSGAVANRIRKEIDHDPKRFLLKVAVGTFAVGVGLKLFFKDRNGHVNRKENL